MRPDAELINLRAKLRKARRASPPAVESVTLSICKGRASSLVGLHLQAVTLCELVDAAAGIDPRAITLARNMRQAIIALRKKAAREA